MAGLDPTAQGGARAALAEYAEEHDLELVFLDPPEVFDHAIIGVIEGYGQDSAVLYDEQLVLDAMAAQGMSPEEAREYFDFNTIGAYVGPATPRFLVCRHAGTVS